MENRILTENQKRLENEDIVLKMEMEEMELIKRLQNTQLMQKAAYEDLEKALGGQDVDLSRLTTSQKKSRTKKNAQKEDFSDL